MSLDMSGDSLKMPLGWDDLSSVESNETIPSPHPSSAAVARYYIGGDDTTLVAVENGINDSNASIIPGNNADNSGVSDGDADGDIDIGHVGGLPPRISGEPRAGAPSLNLLPPPDSGDE